MADDLKSSGCMARVKRLGCSRRIWPQSGEDVSSSGKRTMRDGMALIPESESGTHREEITGLLLNIRSGIRVREVKTVISRCIL